MAEFLKGSVDESLKKLVQPAGLVPAIVLLLLNLGAIYPAVQFGAIERFAKLDGAWQAAIVAALVLLIGYLFVTVSSSVLDILSGLRAPESLVMSGLRLLELWRFDTLETKVGESPTASLRWEQALRFPVTVEGRESVRPTALGNAFAATQVRAYERYGIELTALWSHMEMSTKLKDAPAVTVVKDERAGIELSANLVLALVLFTIEGLVVFLLLERPGDALLCLLALVPAYLSYRGAVTKAQSWGTAVETLLDLHRGDVRKELGLVEPSSNGVEAERTMWQRASEFYLPGSFSEVAEPFLAPTEPDVEVAGPIKVAWSDLTTVESEGSAETVVLVKRVVEIGLTTEAAGTSGAVLVRDPVLDGIDEIDPLPQAEVSGGGPTFTPEPIQTPDGLALVWQTTNLQASTGALLRYEIALTTLRATGGSVTVAPREAAGIRLTFEEQVTELKLTSLKVLSPLPRLLRGNEELDIQGADARMVTWQFAVAAGDVFWLELA